MTKPKVLKDFSDLRPVEARIEALAAQIYQIAWSGEAIDRYKPRVETQIYRVWKMAKLDFRQQAAWKQFRDDVDKAAGKSGGVCSAYGEYSDKGGFGPSDKVPVAKTNKAYNRVEFILDRYLGRRERALLVDLLRDDLQKGGDLNIETIGVIRSGYKDKAQARASGVTHVQNLLDRLADLYGF